MKDGLNEGALKRLSQSLCGAWKDFPQLSFRKAALEGNDQRELKERVQHWILCLDQALPTDYKQALKIVVGAGKHFDPGNPEDNLRSFAAWPLIDWIAHRGRPWPRQSLEGMAKLSHLFTAEFCIRPFLRDDPGQCLPFIQKWAQSGQAPIRRLASEGTRPRLPWGLSYKADADFQHHVLKAIIPFRQDKDPAVKRSLANHLNDLWRTHPAQVLELLSPSLPKPPADDRTFLQHALRNAIKSGDADALSLCGCHVNARIASGAFSIEPARLEFGSSLSLSAEVQNLEKQAVEIVVDYRIHHRRANGSTSPKVFKWCRKKLKTGVILQLQRNHAIRPITTRKYYAGEHKIELLINGKSMADGTFVLHGLP